MGQKTHPYGFRLGVIKPWKSKWFEDKNYAKWLHEDLALKRAITSKFSHAGIADIEIERAANKSDAADSACTSPLPPPPTSRSLHLASTE